MIFVAPILADTDIDLPKIIFGLIFFIIWALSALVSVINKKQQEAKRRRERERLEYAVRRMPGASQPPVERPAPRIAEGLAQRFPDVLMPPAPPPPIPRQQPRPMPPPPPLPPPMPQQRRPVPIPPPIAPHQQQQRRPVPAPARVPTPPKPARRTPKQPQRRVPSPPPVPVEEIEPPSTPIRPIAATELRTTAERSKPTVDAAAISKWLTPATLRQQFILTEILQPPLGVRPDRDRADD